ncbi:MAG: S-layer homology domain-containing protein, partial [Oscillospiraceae bacterium]|nr:S-layer homology domain-containing protein [Oscillospiraceae bacterium]
DLAGRYVFIDNGAQTRSGSFEIKGASRSSEDDKEVTLDVGQVTPIRSFVDGYDHSKGFVYMIAEGQTLRIPTTYSEDFSPEFEPISDLTTSSGSSISVTVTATSPKDIGITYEAEMLPRGASLNAETGVVTWKPTASQVGDNHFAITAIDELGRESTVHFYVTVYGSTTGGTSGGEATAPTTPSTPDKDEDETTTPTTPSTGNEGQTSVENVRFIDLDNHAWAADAINSLADEGIIKGTSENTFSPANNITRADFAILLVRAFKLESDNTENFADVADSDYFAKELAIARNTGIVNGIGDNKYAPRNTITRQDMMVIVYRAMQKLGVELEIADVDYADVADVADYAQDAVKALITAGLVNGKSGKIAPTDYTTRAEVAVLIKRIMDYTAE